MHLEGQRPDLDLVAVLQFLIALNLLPVDDRAVAALEVPDVDLAAFDVDHAVPAADRFALGPHVTLVTTADQALGHRQADLFASAGSLQRSSA